MLRKGSVMIDLSIHQKTLDSAIQRAREKKILLPTFEQMRKPELIPDKVKAQLKSVGLWDINHLNLFRINWHNEPTMYGGGFGKVNKIEIPSELSGVDARIFVILGKWFPTGCHKVGASYGCLTPRLVTGQFDPTFHKAVWPSTGNYCRGGAYNSKLLGCESVAILPAEMSQERFDWLKSIAGEVIATPGCESNVKEIFDKTWELRQTREDCVIFNQFEEMGNVIFHYNVTGPALEEAYRDLADERSRFAGVAFTSGSAGTMSAGDYLKDHFPGLKLAVGEALQCPTILENGFGGHRIEGIGDKHVPWVHNIRNTDMVIDIDDNDSQNLLRLFNSEVGHAWMEKNGFSRKLLEDLSFLGISGIANVLCCIKMAKFYELTKEDVLGTVATDSAAMYSSRITELDEQQGAYTADAAARDFWTHLRGMHTDNMAELGYRDRKRIHNLKYYTWVEQQNRDVAELNAQWYDPAYWNDIHNQVQDLDALIKDFNEKSGVLDLL